MSITTDNQKYKQSSIVTKYLKQPWMLTLHICITFIMLLANSFSSWIIVNDLNELSPGLVYDKISRVLIGCLILFNIIELTLSLLELLLWINILKKKFKLWLLIDCITIVNTLLAEIPLSIIYTYTCACQESITSIGFLTKGIFTIIFICLRLSICLISYIHQKSNDSYISKSTTSTMRESQYLLHSHKCDKEFNKTSNDLEENLIWKQNYWALIRVMLVTSFFCLIILICTMFSFQFVQPYPNYYLQWSHINEQDTTHSSFLNLITNHYFHNVEIFLEDNSNRSQTKWFHLLCLDQIIRLKHINANESVTLAFYTYGRKKYIEFKQTIYYQNNTKEHGSSCWQKINQDLYKEFICPTPGTHNVKLIQGIKVYFTYIPPSKKQRLGTVLYNATRVTTTRHKVGGERDLKLKYFQNTIADFSSKKPMSSQSNHDHDEWSSGPFRSNNLQADDQQYTKYRSSDLVSIKELWKTGIAKCQSTAPMGPQRM
ncbi:unnamed protein product [Schistosoma turkestanicum]|nr:unnamed protein product [Schistosoma turkestanicum]